MLNLIRKDLLLNKPAFYGYIPVLVNLAYLATEVSSQNVFITFACIMSAILPMVLITREDKFGSGAFFCSLPVTRRQTVRAKYVVCLSTAFILSMIGFVLYSFFAPEDGVAIWCTSSASRVLLILTVGLGLAIPFSFRFGWVGLIACLVGMQMLGIVGLLISQTFATGLQPRDIFGAISGFLTNIHSQLGGPLAFVAVVCVVIVLNLVSCRIAEVSFERREL
ncbi:MAG: ABC-2 transporter permease [Fuerstiella sp.]|nr:ABC-2 transporter permease [Fuerstiella sp.]MCP4858377.1 ABC-2 transporter permease [Fuerstiella sp.]